MCFCTDFIFFSIVNSGAYRIINGTCAHEETPTVTLAGQNKCPALRDLELPCTYTTGCIHTGSIWLLCFLLIIMQIFN